MKTTMGNLQQEILIRQVLTRGHRSITRILNGKEVETIQFSSYEEAMKCLREKRKNEEVGNSDYWVLD